MFHLSTLEMLPRFVFLMAKNVGRTTRSLLTNNDWPMHLNALSPLVGSFQDSSQQFELPKDLRLKVLTQAHKQR